MGIQSVPHFWQPLNEGKLDSEPCKVRLVRPRHFPIPQPPIPLCISLIGRLGGVRLRLPRYGSRGGSRDCFVKIAKIGVRLPHFDRFTLRPLHAINAPFIPVLVGIRRRAMQPIQPHGGTNVLPCLSLAFPQPVEGGHFVVSPLARLLLPSYGSRGGVIHCSPERVIKLHVTTERVSSI